MIDFTPGSELIVAKAKNGHLSVVRQTHPFVFVVKENPPFSGECPDSHLKAGPMWAGLGEPELAWDRRDMTLFSRLHLFQTAPRLNSR